MRPASRPRALAPPRVAASQEDARHLAVAVPQRRRGSRWRGAGRTPASASPRSGRCGRWSRSPGRRRRSWAGRGAPAAMPSPRFPSVSGQRQTVPPRGEEAVHLLGIGVGAVDRGDVGRRPQRLQQQRHRTLAVVGDDLLDLPPLLLDVDVEGQIRAGAPRRRSRRGPRGSPRAGCGPRRRGSPRRGSRRAREAVHLLPVDLGRGGRSGAARPSSGWPTAPGAVVGLDAGRCGCPPRRRRRAPASSKRAVVGVRARGGGSSGTRRRW